MKRFVNSVVRKQINFKSNFCTMLQSGRSIVAVCQMTAKNNKENNFEVCQSLVAAARQQNAKMVFLPEACDYVGESRAETLALAESLSGPFMEKYCHLAKENEVWLSLGGIHEKVSAEKVSNSHVIIDNNGNIVTVYRKIHLFDVDLPESGIKLKESDYVDKGMAINMPVSTPVGNVGLAICYDMRFPEMALELSQLGADILTYPSAFTFATGAAHWEVLLRARAIETQCYVVAAAQTGAHNQKRSSWGHAMVIDPWGSIIAQCTEGTDVSVAEIKHSRIKNVRASMPVWQHRRDDLYTILTTVNNFPEPEQESYKFGHTTILAAQVFYKSKHSIAFTNIRCVVLGHVLVMPIRNATRLSELSLKELGDLFLTVQKAQSVVEKVYNLSSSTIAIQDGVHAGQTVEHLHVHICPRRKGDFLPNDRIYLDLQGIGTSQKEGRSVTEMAEEAELLRSHINGKIHAL